MYVLLYIVYIHIYTYIYIYEFKALIIRSILLPALLAGKLWIFACRSPAREQLYLGPQETKIHREPIVDDINPVKGHMVSIRWYLGSLEG